MNKTANEIRCRLSLRPPQAESLEILSEIANTLELKKDTDIKEAKAEIKELGKKFKEVQRFSDFERDFPNICFALATGVGKTRLMGAFVTYLYLEKGIKNFLILAPRTTVYKKLIDDFSNPSNPKYVFKGISVFAQKSPFVVTGETYNKIQSNNLFNDIVKINIFNIDKINRNEKGSDGISMPRVRRLSEYLGESYFDYLKNLPDLVMLMDESHHYRANAAMRAIGELNPILGIEVTATPQTETGSSTKKFKNVVYEYSLAKALRDGYCKQPAVATRENTDFDKLKLPEEEMDKLKLRDGVSFHEDTKYHLEMYALENNKPLVKPFVLVIAKDTPHADRIYQYITSDEFFNGTYKNKVMVYHSNLSGAESTIAEAQLISLEKPENKIEIVIHVDKLKEGWDVNNLYTIVPLRKFDSTTLGEQTLGRGLRLPYGQRTGNKKVDMLTVVVHKKFQEIINAAREDDSIINKENFIDINIDDEEVQEQLNQRKIIITTNSILEQKLQEEEKQIEQILDTYEKEEAKKKLDRKVSAQNAFLSLSKQGLNINQMTKEQVISEMYKQKIQRISEGQKIGTFFDNNENVEKTIIQQSLLQEQQIEQIKEEQILSNEEFEKIKNEFRQLTINIPKIIVQPVGTTETHFNPFKVDFSSNAIKFSPTEAKLLRENLVSGEQDSISATNLYSQKQPSPNQIVSKLIDIPEVNYDKDKIILFDIANQVIDYYHSYIPEEKDIENLIPSKINEIFNYIKPQLMSHFCKGETVYDEPKVYPFVRIEPHHYTQIQGQQLYDYRDNVTDKSKIKSMLFTNFKKACHEVYQFDSNTEKVFSIILEKQSDVLKWLKPAANQFNIFWFDGCNPHRYEPDFVVETENIIYLIETKKANAMNDSDVLEKAKAALIYCKNATKYNLKNGGKVWKYILLPHDSVQENMTFEYLVKQYEYNKE